MDDFCTYQLKITFALDLFLITKMKNLNTKYEMNNEKTTERLYYTVTRLLWGSRHLPLQSFCAGEATDFNLVKNQSRGHAKKVK